MMKKRVFAIICLLLVSFAFASLVLAADTVGDQIDSGAKKVEQTFQDTEKMFSTETRQEFLHKQWVELFLTKPIIGDVMRAYMKMAPHSDPVFEYVVGAIPAFSWFFIVLLLIWIDFVRVYIAAYEMIKDIFTFSGWVSFVVAVCIFVILTIVGFFQSLSISLTRSILGLIDLLTTPWVKIVAGVVVIVVVVLLGVFAKEIKAIAFVIKRKMREAQNETLRTERDMRAERATKKVETIAKGLQEGLGR